MTDRVIRPPWTPEQVTALNAFQRSGRMHPFTCGGDHPGSPVLVAHADGWHCPDPHQEGCDYRQDWAHPFMVDLGQAAAPAVVPEQPATTPEPRQETGAIGVGMPAVLHLGAFARELTEAFGVVPYLVGSAARGKTWRDVDIRIMLPDDEFDRLFPHHTKPDRTDGLWSLLCMALAELGRQRTGLPVDLQIQRTTDANRLYPGIRHALGIAHHPRGYDTDGGQPQ